MANKGRAVWITVLFLFGSLFGSVYFFFPKKSVSDGLTHQTPGPITNLKQFVQEHKALRREYFQLLSTQLDRFQDEQIAALEDAIQQKQLSGSLSGPSGGHIQVKPSSEPGNLGSRSSVSSWAEKLDHMSAQLPTVRASPSASSIPSVPASQPARIEPAAATYSSVGDALLHRAEVTGKDAVVGFAAYDRNILGLFKSFVKPLRAAGFAGHIILGCRRDLDSDEKDFLQEYRVTSYAIDLVPCDLPWMKSKDTSKKKFTSESERIRGVCVKQYPKLKMEWARFQLGADWLLVKADFLC